MEYCILFTNGKFLKVFFLIITAINEMFLHMSFIFKHILPVFFFVFGFKMSTTVL